MFLVSSREALSVLFIFSREVHQFYQFLSLFAKIKNIYIYIYITNRDQTPSNKDSTPPGWDAEVDSWQTNLSHAACPWGGRLVKVILSDVDVRDAPERKSYMLVPCMQQLECLS